MAVTDTNATLESIKVKVKNIEDKSRKAIQDLRDYRQELATMNTDFSAEFAEIDALGTSPSEENEKDLKNRIVARGTAIHGTLTTILDAVDATGVNV